MKYIFAIAALQLFAGSCDAQSTGLAIVKTFHIQSGGGWDYLAVVPGGNELYVSHGMQVNILNKATGDSIGVIPGTVGVHGIAFDTALGKGFISNGRLNNVFVFNLKTHKILDSIRTGENPDAIFYEPFTRKIITCNGRSRDASVIDPARDQVVATIPLGGKPETAVSDGKGRMYVAIEDKNEIAEVSLDKDTWAVVRRYKLGEGEEPAGLAIDKAKGILFAGCGNKKMIVLDAQSGRQIASLPIGEHCDGTGFDAGTGNAYAANGDGTLTVIHATGKTAYQVVENVPTKRGARTIAVDQSTHQVYLPTADFEPQTSQKERPKMIPRTFEILVIGKR